MRVLPSGERAVLVEVDTAEAAHALAAHLRTTAGHELAEIVPGARTVLVAVAEPEQLPWVHDLIGTAPPTTAVVGPGPEVEIAVTYDGADLADVAERTGLTAQEVVARHSAARYVVEFVGFAPGFGYLRGLDPVLHLPRLQTPRPSVPPGSVAIAGPYTAVYPRSSPGGWRLLGRTETTVFDVDADPPSLLTAGTVVRFVPQ